MTRPEPELVQGTLELLILKSLALEELSWLLHCRFRNSYSPFRY